MAEIALGLAGAGLGSLPGGISIATGFQVGVALGSILFPPEGPRYDRGRVDEIRIQNAQQSTPIPIIYGRNRTSGTILWASGLKERSKSSTQGGKGGGGGVTTTEYFYSTNMAVAVCEGPVTKIRRIWANDVVIYDWRTGGGPTVADWVDLAKVRIYLGNQTAPDSAIEADKGVGNVPAFKGLCYVVFEDFQLAELGNQIPNFTFEVETAWADVKEVMEDLADRVGLSATDYDFSALAGMPVRGFIIGARTEAVRAMEALARANWFEIVESNGVIKAVIRTGVPVLTIPQDDIGASADGEVKGYVTTTRAQEVELPREFQVTYNSENQDFQAWNQVARRTVRWSENQESVTFPMALSDTYARFLADSLLMETWVSRNIHAFTLPYKYLRLDPGDVVNIPDEAGNTRAVRILEMNAGLLAEIEVKAVDDDPVIYIDPGLPAAVPSGGGSGVSTSGPATLFARECNALVDGQADTPNIYLAAGRLAPGWRGGDAQVSPKLQKLGGSYQETIASFAVGATIGRTDNSLAGVLPVGPVGSIDRTSSLTVTMVSGTLSSVTEEQMIKELANMAVVGDEVIQFQTATLVSGSTYILTNLLRGRRGTEYALDDHVPNEPFVLVNSRALFYDYATKHRGETAQFRLIENGRDYSGGLPVFGSAIVLECRSRKPYAPVHLRGSGDRSAGTASVSLSWVRRVRKGGDLQDLLDAPLDETAEAYDLEIWDASATTLLRTVTGITTPSYTYSVADQTTDGVQTSAFAFRVFQTTTEGGIGRGHASGYKTVPLFPLD